MITSKYGDWNESLRPLLPQKKPDNPYGDEVIEINTRQDSRPGRYWDPFSTLNLGIAFGLAPQNTRQYDRLPESGMTACLVKADIAENEANYGTLQRFRFGVSSRHFRCGVQSALS